MDAAQAKMFVRVQVIFSDDVMTELLLMLSRFSLRCSVGLQEPPSSISTEAGHHLRKSWKHPGRQPETLFVGSHTTKIVSLNPLQQTTPPPRKKKKIEYEIL